jgi:hypothetical protein
MNIVFNLSSFSQPTKSVAPYCSKNEPPSVLNCSSALVSTLLRLSISETWQSLGTTTGDANQAWLDYRVVKPPNRE